MTWASLEHSVTRVPSFDGTALAMRVLGDERDAVPLVVVPTVGTDLSPWRGVLRRLVARRRVVTWDMRGFGESALPLTHRVDPGAHAEDSVAVLNAAGIERAHLAAWSTGARIALEIAHRHPDRVGRLVLVCGAYGYPLPRLARRLHPSALFPLVAGIGKHFAGPIGAALKAVSVRPEVAGLVRQSGIVGATADVPALVDMLRSLAGADTRAFLATYEAVAGDAAPEILPEIDARTLLIAGERDQFTPRSLMEDMATAIPSARFELYERGTHYVPLEFPDRLAEDIEEFLSPEA